MYVIPAAGLKVPDPAMQGAPREVYFLPPDGREVEPSDYWYRRLQEGDVTERPGDSPAP
jgi:hypothetical protein